MHMSQTIVPCHFSQLLDFDVYLVVSICFTYVFALCLLMNNEGQCLCIVLSGTSCHTLILSERKPAQFGVTRLQGS